MLWHDEEHEDLNIVDENDTSAVEDIIPEKAAEKAAAEVKKVEEEAKAAVSKKRKAAASKRGRKKKKWTMPQTLEEIPLWKKRKNPPIKKIMKS